MKINELTPEFRKNLEKYQKALIKVENLNLLLNALNQA